MPLESSKLQRWLPIVQLLVTLALVPAVRWGWLISEQQQHLEMQHNELRNQFLSEQRAVETLFEEFRSVRSSIDGLKTELLQRLTRVETKIEGQAK
jgi:hypothetical protein